MAAIFATNGSRVGISVQRRRRVEFAYTMLHAGASACNLSEGK